MENEDQNLAFNNMGTVEDTTFDKEGITPEVVSGQFAAPFNSSIGKSSVNLEVKGNGDKMLEEYNNWWKMGLNWGVVSEDAKPE